MTDRLAALRAMVNRDGAEVQLAEFAERWRDDALVMDKWFNLQALSRRPGALSRVQQLTEHTAFSIRNPNKVIALELGVSESTVKVHRHNVMNKMRFRSLPELALAMQRLKTAS